MAKKSKQPLKTKKEKRAATRRQERRFVSQAATSPVIVRSLGAIAAILLGAGLWAYFYAKSFEDEKLKPIPSYLIAGGAVLMGITIWIGTSSDSPLRVGAPGIAMEKGEVRRMPWWSVSKIKFDSSALALIVLGKDEAGSDWTIKVPLKTHAEAIGWILKEALDRIPKRVAIDDEAIAKMPEAHEHSGLKVDLEPLQVVGKKCAITGKMISYEPDARVCTRCERVYVKKAVPRKCKCGSSLIHLRPKDADEDYGEDSEEDDDDDDIRSSSRVEAAPVRTTDPDEDDGSGGADDDSSVSTRTKQKKEKEEETADT